MEVASCTLHWVFAGTPRREEPGGPRTEGVFVSSDCLERCVSEKSGKLGWASGIAFQGACVTPLTRGISEASSMRRLIRSGSLFS